MKNESIPLLIKKRYRILFISVLSLLLAIGGYFYYNYSANQIRAEELKDLTAIAQLKINQIVQWHKERDADAEVISNGPFFLNAIQKWLQIKNDKASTTYIQTKLSQNQKAYEYEAIILSSVNGEVLLSAGSNLAHLDKETSDRIIEAVKHRKIEHTDFYYCITEQKIHYDIIAPLINDKNNVIAAIVLRVDPVDFLYPLIQTWPTPSKTAETLLIRKKGDKVLFLNNLKFRKDVALKLEIPLTEKDVPSVQAVLGYKGIWEGKDYRGVKVLSYINNVPGTKWYIVSKIDNDEIFSELRFRGGVIILFILLLILSITAGLSWVYRFHQSNIYKELYTTQEGFKATLYSIGDAVITTDSKGKVQHLNLVAERMTGWSEADAKGEKLENVFKIINEETRNKLENPIRKVLAEGFIIGIANHTLLISKDGKEIPIADSGAPIKDETGEIVGVVLVFRDQTDERNARNVLRRNEEQFRSVFENSPIGKSMTGIDGSIKTNKAYRDMLGYSLDEFDNKNWKEITHPDDIQKSIEVAESLLNGEKSLCEFEKRYIHKDGSIIFTEVRTTLQKDEQGKPLYFITTIIDITERKRAEEELNLLSTRHSAILDSVPDIIMEVDNNKIYTWANSAGTEFFGDDVIGKEAAVYFEGEQDTYTNVQPVFNGSGDIVYLESLQRRKDGEIRLLAWWCRAIKDQKGNVTGVLSAAQDITERERAENAIIENEKFLKETQKIAQLGSYTLDVNTGIWKSSEILDSIFGIEPDFDKSVEGWTSIIHPEWQHLMANYFANEVVGQRKSFDKQYKIIRRNDKSERWVHGLGELVFDNDNNPIQMIGTIRDITELKNAEQEIINLNRIYALLSNTNEAIVRIKDRQKLFNEICRIAIEDGKFRMAWIGLVNYDTNKVDVAAAAGVIENYLELINIDLNDEIRSQGPTGSAVKNGKHSIANDIENDKNMLPWKENDLRLGYKSSVAFPLKVFGKIIGAFSIYSNQKNFFHVQEIRLLDEMAMDISFALEFFETEKIRIKTEENLYQSEERFRTLYENSTIGLYRTTPDGKIILANPTLVRMLGYSSFEELAARDLEKDGFEPDYNRKQFLEQIEMNGEVKGFEAAWTTKEGKIVYISESARAIHDSVGKTLFYDGTVEDITERKLTEVALRESEKSYRELIDGMNETVWVIDFNGDLMDVNKTAVEVLGYSKEELLNIGLYGIDSSLKKEEIKALAKVMPSDKLQIFETSHKTKDGTTFPVEVYSSLVTYHGKKAILSIVRNITERKRAEEELKKSEEKYRSIFENVQDVYYETLLDGTILEVSPSIELMSKKQYRRTDLIGRSMYEFYADAEIRTAILSAMQKDGRVNDFEVQLKNKDGSVIHCSVSAKLSFNAEGRPEKIVGSMHDITERKQALEALIESEERYRSIAQSANDAIITTDSKGMVINWNYGAEKIFGYPEKEIIGKNLSIIIPQTHLENHINGMKRIEQGVKHNIMGRTVELSGLHRDGKEFPLELSLAAWETLSEKFFTGIIRDITERKFVEAELIQAKEKAEEMSRLKSNFLANMSHELRTPLVGILGYADILSHDVELPEIKLMAESIYKSGSRLSETLNLILDLSQFETEKRDINYQKIDIVSKSKEIINSFNGAALKKGLDLISSFNQERIIINFDERALHSILNNLINNALKFTSEGSITTTINRHDDFVEIKVIDTGIGINEKDYQIIFEEFRQVSEGYSRNFEGSGLGLSITKKLIEKFGGSISVESEIGKGSTFTVKLPVINIEENEKDLTLTKAKIPKKPPEQIPVKPLALLVDDDRFVYMVLKRYTNEYIELDTTLDAEFAFKMLKKKKYDLIFMDINLRRGLDGKEVTKKIRTMKGYESIPIIATTAYAMVGDKEEFLAAGCTHYLSKPFSKTEIDELLEKVLKLV